MKLGEFISLQRGHDLTERHRRPGDIPVMGAAGQNGVHDVAIAKGPGVIVGRSGASFGQVHYSDKDYWPHNTALYVTDFQGNDPLFVFFFLKGMDFSRHNTGGAQPSLNRNFIYPIPITVPEPSEQKLIAEALRDVDALIGSLDRLIAKKRNLKQATMQQLLTGQTRLPGFSGEWGVKRLGDVAFFYSGGTPSTDVAEYYVGDIPWITSGDLNQGRIREVHGRISRKGLENSAAKMIEADTLLIALYGATSGVTAISDIRAAINQAVLAIVPHRDSTCFLYFKLRHLKEWLISTYTQGGQPNLSGDIVKSIELPMPQPEEQDAIAEVLSDMEAETEAMEARRDKTRLLKQGMMQELLTGRIRLV